MIQDRDPVGITELVLRDAHQSLFATRLRLEDMLPIADKIDEVGFWSVETWGGATFDSCIRYLGEDPWHRIRELKKAIPNTRHQMLFRAQNILGYRHYADDVVIKFCERAATNGVDVFRIFDAMNDARNMETAIKAVKEIGKHAQGTLSYTLSPVHNIDTWVDLAKKLEDMGSDSICIKDMAGLLHPYDAYELVKRLKEETSLPIHSQSHATTGLSVPTILKQVEAGIDNVDTAISSMSMTYGHSPTETVNAMLHNRPGDPGLNLELLAEIAEYFRVVRKKYAKFEGALKGVDARILLAQVPGGMLTNMENQLRDQQASEKMAEVLEEIPRVREDLGSIALVTPTSQIVGTQAVINVLTGERYKTITKETAGILKGEYGSTPAPMNKELQAKVLDGAEPITCRPADLLKPEMERLTEELRKKAKEEGIKLEEGEREVDDVLTYALFPEIGLKFLKNRGNPDAFEPAPTGEESTAAPAPAAKAGDASVYTVSVNGESYVVQVSEGGDVTGLAPVASSAPAAAPKASGKAEAMNAPLSGNIFKINVTVGQSVAEGDVMIILEAMKMETEVKASRGGVIQSIDVAEGNAVSVGDVLLTIS
ncbi:MAG: oxaloacetate decarboxylase subunit alpha [Gammaproteobacteria bacterium]|nr:oxaloacetate decarboxylase subunit alpha [Gammaproteobacteria bacterium]MAY02032.1 oxaloacetate decarboxylase subunit alpha [Gammaproteobacteria bacterium]|tara:strand:- start:373 stop:2163 length:1791 start_codon:yes stop_codon:yes gene_type:complete